MAFCKNCETRANQIDKNYQIMKIAIANLFDTERNNKDISIVLSDENSLQSLDN